MITKKIIYSIDAIDRVVSFIKKIMPSYAVLTLSGPLGAGKTTLVRALLRAHGISDGITSPTYTYVNVYSTNDEHLFYHFDLYRIDSVQAFQEAGFDEYIYQKNSHAIIEWPEVITPLLTHSVCEIRLDYHDNHDKRIAVITCKK